jgi:phosphoribosyl-AMP cyclohydrolase
MIEGSIDDDGVWPYGQIHLALVDLYNAYRPKSQLNRIQLDMDKLTIKMADNDHPDVLFELAMMVRKKYWRRRTKPTWDELISCIVTSSSLFYQTHFTTIMLKLDHEQDGQIVMNAMKQLGNELYTASHLSRTNVESAHETSLVQFKRKQQDQWTKGMQCYWCWKLGHKSSDCSRRQAGQPKLPKPGSTITGAPGGGGNNNNSNNNNNDGGGKTQAS